jgi:hypothetical protein
MYKRHVVYSKSKTVRIKFTKMSKILFISRFLFLPKTLLILVHAVLKLKSLNPVTVWIKCATGETHKNGEQRIVNYVK